MVKQQNFCEHQYSIFLKFVKPKELKKHCSVCFKTLKEIENYTVSYRSIPIMKRDVFDYESKTAQYKYISYKERKVYDLANLCDHFYYTTKTKKDLCKLRIQIISLLPISPAILYLLFKNDWKIHDVVDLIIFVILIIFFIILLFSVFAVDRFPNGPELYKKARRDRDSLGIKTHITETKILKHFYGEETEINQRQFSDIDIKYHENWNKWILSLERNDSNIHFIKNRLLHGTDIIKFAEENKKVLWDSILLNNYNIIANNQIIDEYILFKNSEGNLREVILAEVIRSNNIPLNSRIDATKQLNNKDMINLLSRIVDTPEIRKVLFEKIVDKEIIKDIALNAMFADIRKMAIERVNDIEFLMELIKHELDLEIIKKAQHEIINLIRKIKRKNLIKTFNDTGVFIDDYIMEADDLKKYKTQIRNEILEKFNMKIIRGNAYGLEVKQIISIE